MSRSRDRSGCLRSSWPATGRTSGARSCGAPRRRLAPGAVGGLIEGHHAVSLGNWDSLEEHLRGNLEGFTQAASEQKWLDVHAGNHLEGVLGDYYTRLQMRFFDHFLKGEDNGWEREPRVHLHVRPIDGRQTDRYEHEWPLARTDWTPFYLDRPLGG